MPKLIFTIGVPTAGKSYWADKQTDFWVISRDRIRMSIYGHLDYNKIDEGLVTKIFWEKLNIYTGAYLDIIIDNQNVKLSYIKDVVDKLPKEYSIEFKLFPVSYPLAYIRNVKRRIFENKWIPLDYLKQCINNYKKLTDEKQYLDFKRLPHSTQ